MSFIAYASSPSASSGRCDQYEMNWRMKESRTVPLLDILHCEAKSVAVETKGGAVRFSDVQGDVGGAVY